MTRAIAILTVGVLLAPLAAQAQEVQSTGTAAVEPSLADIAKAEEARRKTIRKPAKVYTNNNLKPDNSPSQPAPSLGAPSTTVPQVNLPGGTAEPAPAPAPAPASPERGPAYWSGRITAARDGLARSQIFADSLQSRINALTTDFVNRDDPAQKAKIANDRQAALAELDRVKKEIEATQKQIVAIEEEARRAGVPSGWLRPGA